MANYRIFCFGDSIAQGALDTEGGWADRLKRSLMQRELDHLVGDRYQVYNLGIGGDTSHSLARRVESELSVRTSEDWSNVCIIAIGINDSSFNIALNRVEVELEEYRQNLLQIIAAARKSAVKIAFIGITPVAKDKITFKGSRYENKEIQKYDKILSRTVKELQIPKLEILKDAMDNNTFMASLQLDEIHPDSPGHEWLHNRIEPFILRILEA